MLTPSFHFNILKTFNGMINSHAKELRDKLMKDACDTGQSYDIDFANHLIVIKLMLITLFIYCHLNKLSKNDQ